MLYEFDDAGRRTLVSLRRVELDGDLVAEVGRYEATYESSGFVASTTLGPQDPEQRVYDPDGSGDLDQIIRGDGDEVDLVTV